MKQYNRLFYLLFAITSALSLWYAFSLEESYFGERMVNFLYSIYLILCICIWMNIFITKQYLKVKLGKPKRSLKVNRISTFHKVLLGLFGICGIFLLLDQFLEPPLGGYLSGFEKLILFILMNLFLLPIFLRYHPNRNLYEVWFFDDKTVFLSNDGCEELKNSELISISESVWSEEITLNYKEMEETKSTFFSYRRFSEEEFKTLKTELEKLIM